VAAHLLKWVHYQRDVQGRDYDAGMKDGPGSDLRVGKKNARG
jgi:hypothetical protein